MVVLPKGWMNRWYRFNPLSRRARGRLSDSTGPRVAREVVFNSGVFSMRNLLVAVKEFMVA
ncbi:hypothetical protein K2Y11_02220, partial [bacterium]|nr:hypothetical protein [bacterium]